jgi:hypothetical protein
MAVAMLCCCTLSVRAQAPSVGTLAGFAGHWFCNGHFESNGAEIAGELSIESDERSGALIVRHDDVAPGAYHALEIWMPNKEGTGLRAAISDKYSGMRWFDSPGWVGKTLTWTRWDHGVAAESFAYELGTDRLQVQWSVARAGAMKLGDTLVCRREKVGRPTP